MSDDASGEHERFPPVEEPPRNRRAVVYVPFDESLSNLGSFRTASNYREISVAALESDDPSRRRNPGLMRRYIDLQILRIITGNKEHVASVCNKKMRSRSTERHFCRLYLL